PSIVGFTGGASMLANTSDPGSSPCVTTPSRLRSIAPERRPPPTRPTPASSIASGRSSTSCPPSVAPVSKSGSSSSGGTSTMGLRAGGPGRFGTTGLTLGDSGAFGLAPPNRGGAPTPGRFGTTGATGDGAFATGASISISVSKSGWSSTAESGALSSSGTVGSNSAGGGISSGETSSRSEGTSAASRSMSPNSALVVSNPSSVPPAFVASSPSTRLVDSISRDVSGSAVTGSIRLSTAGSGSSAGSGSGSGTGLGGIATRPFPGGPLATGGASTSRNTRLDVFRLPDFDGSSGGCALGAAGAAA